MTLDLNKAAMLINKEDITKEVKGDVTTFTHTESNVTIEYCWAGAKKGSCQPIQVIDYDEDDKITEIYEFETDEKGFWEAVDKFQDIIADKTNQNPPPPDPPPCIEEDAEAALRLQLQENGLPEAQIEETIKAMTPLCLCDENKEEANTRQELKDQGMAQDLIDSTIAAMKPFCEEEGGKGKGKGKAECKPEVVVALTGVERIDVADRFRTMDNLLSTLRAISESEFTTLGVDKTEFLEMTERCVRLYFPEEEEPDDNPPDDNPPDVNPPPPPPPNEDEDLWAVIESLTGIPKQDLALKFRTLRNLTRTISGFQESDFTALKANKKSIINKLSNEGQSLFQ